MAKPMTAVQVLAAMKLWDVPYKQWPGWTTRGRDPEHGPFSDVHGLVIHHTGSDSGQSDDYLDFLATRGRPGLPGPLCNAATDMDGDLWLIAQGRANHAGQGSNATLNHVINEDYAGFKVELKPGPDNIDGNAVYYGNEVRYDGGQPMTAKQYAAVTRWAAAICHFHGWSALSIIGHREHTGRKNDPGNCAMNEFRADVAALLKAGPPQKPAPAPITPTTPTGDLMADLRNDIVGNDSDGSPMTMGQLAARTNALYTWFLDNGKHGARLVRIDKELAEGGDTDTQLDRIEDDTDDGTVTP
ncbi:MAG TPA: N-acetylmuramoyl-L-alanine amidase [Pseudonocardia sp.]